MANKSPPIPLPVGSINPRAALAAIAASTAEPPCFKTSTAIEDASGCAVAAMPLTAITGLRDQFSPMGRAPGPKSCAATLKAKIVVDNVARHRLIIVFMVNSLSN